jgi:hypothetical protein
MDPGILTVVGFFTFVVIALLISIQGAKDNDKQ